MTCGRGLDVCPGRDRRSFVHESAGADSCWALGPPYLEPRFTLYAVQRRGRDRSSGGPEYSLGATRRGITRFSKPERRGVQLGS